MILKVVILSLMLLLMRYKRGKKVRIEGNKNNLNKNERCDKF